jgi:hypothetical protein
MPQDRNHDFCTVKTRLPRILHAKSLKFEYIFFLLHLSLPRDPRRVGEDVMTLPHNSTSPGGTDSTSVSDDLWSIGPDKTSSVFNKT